MTRPAPPPYRPDRDLITYMENYRKDPSMTNEEVNLQSVVKTVLTDAVKYAAVALVVLGAVPAIAQGLGAAHIVVPAAVTTYATIATGLVSGFLGWAKASGVTPASVARSIVGH